LLRTKNLKINHEFRMEKFLLIVRADIEKLRKISEAERYSGWPDMLGWVKSIADSGNHIAGAPLDVHGRYVTREAVLSDGPFIESKEGVLGFDIIQAENIEQAVAIAQSCPMVQRGLAKREVRPIVSLKT
jgi:hypothetical protein